MPELPEVETIRRELNPLLGKTITRVDVIRNTIVFPFSERFYKKLPERRITEIQRRGKYLIFNLDNGFRLIFHFRLSGRLIIAKKRELKYDRLVISFKDTKLHFVEPRALGRAYLIGYDENPHELNGLFGLGPEPFERRFTVKYLKGRFSNRKGRIKNLLLDQSIIAGLGNIYSDEALFVARISPCRPAGSLSDSEIRRLHNAIKKVLREAIKHLGTSVSDYERPDGTKGNFQFLLNVYRREGLACKICGRKIKRLKVGNRSWRYCPTCQK